MHAQRVRDNRGDDEHHGLGYVVVRTLVRASPCHSDVDARLHALEFEPLLPTESRHPADRPRRR